MKASGPSSLLPWIVHRGDWKSLRQAFSPLWSYSPAERTYVSGIKKARLRRRLWPPVGGRLCRRVMKEKVQESCGIAAFGGDEYIACVTGFPSRLPLVILSLRRRILVRAAYETNAIKYQSAGRLPIDSQPKIFRCSSALSPSSIPVGQTKGRSFMGRLREGFARFDNPMQDYHLGKEPDSSTGAVVPPS